VVEKCRTCWIGLLVMLASVLLAAGISNFYCGRRIRRRELLPSPQSLQPLPNLRPVRICPPQ